MSQAEKQTFQKAECEIIWYLANHLFYFITISSCCFQNMENTQQGLGSANRGRDKCIIQFPGGVFHVFSQESKQWKKIGQVRKSVWYLHDDWNVSIILLVQHYQSHDYSFKHLKGSKRYETFACVRWDIQCKPCTACPSQIQTRSRVYQGILKVNLISKTFFKTLIIHFKTSLPLWCLTGNTSVKWWRKFIHVWC